MSEHKEAWIMYIKFSALSIALKDAMERYSTEGKSPRFYVDTIVRPSRFREQAEVWFSGYPPQTQNAMLAACPEPRGPKQVFIDAYVEVVQETVENLVKAQLHLDRKAMGG